MSLDPQQQQFAASVPSAPLLDDAMKKLGQGIDVFMNEVVIGGLDKMITAGVSRIKELGAAPLFAMGRPLEGDPALLPSTTPSRAIEASEKGQSKQIELSPTPELKIAIEKSGPSNLAQGLKCEHCDNAMYGQLSPTPVSYAMAQTKNQGMSV